jgi:hypothetical protein
MHNGKHIEAFIAKVAKEASEAAQKVYNKHQPKLEQMIKNQLRSGDKFWIGMGTASIENAKGETIAEKLSMELAQTQYWQRNGCEAGFSLNDIKKD